LLVLCILGLYGCVTPANAEALIVSFETSGSYLKADIEGFATFSAKQLTTEGLTVTSAVSPSGTRFKAEFTITADDLTGPKGELAKSSIQKAYIDGIIAAGIPYVDGTFTVGGTVTTVTGYGLYEAKLKIQAADLDAAKTVAVTVQTELRKYFDYNGISVIAQEITARRSLSSKSFQLVIMVAGTTDVIATAKANAENAEFQKGLYAKLSEAKISVVPDSLIVDGKVR